MELELKNTNKTLEEFTAGEELLKAEIRENQRQLKQLRAARKGLERIELLAEAPARKKPRAKKRKKSAPAVAA